MRASHVLTNALYSLQSIPEGVVEFCLNSRRINMETHIKLGDSSVYLRVDWNIDGNIFKIFPRLNCEERWIKVAV